MLRRVKPEVFVAAPVGCFVAGPGYLVWCLSPTLSGTALWGAHNAERARELIRLWDHDRRLHGFDSIVDAGRLRWIDAESLEVVSSYLRANLDRYPQIVRRQLLIVPSDPLAGSVVAGIPAFLELRHSWRAFVGEREGLEWLERPEIEPAYAEVRRLVGEACSQGAPLFELREYLTHHPRVVSIDTVSRALGLSARSLQRHLQQQRSSFRDELRRARVRVASALLAATDLKLEAVAREVGYSSSSHFAAVFFQECGEHPLPFRQLRRESRPAG